MKTYKLVKTRSGVVKQAIEIETSDLVRSMMDLAMQGIDEIMVSNQHLSYSKDNVRCELELSTADDNEICTILAKTI